MRSLFSGERHGLESVVASSLAAFAAFAASVLLARALGPDGRGRVAGHLAGIASAAALGSLGVNYAAGFAAARSGRSASAFKSVLRLGGLSLLATLAIDLALEVFVVHTSWGAELAWALAGALTTQSSSIALGWMQGARAIRSWNVLRSAPYWAHLAFLGALTAAGVLTPMTAVAAFAVAQGGVVLFFALTFRERVDGASVGATMDPREIWRFSRGIAVSAALYQINQRLDQLWLAFLHRDADLGVYASAVTLAGVGLPFASGLAQVTYAEGLHATAGERGKLTRRRLALAIAVTGLCAVALTGGARPLMAALYGAPFARGGIALAILAWGAVCLAGNYVAAESLRSSGRSGATIRADAIAVAVSLVALPFAIRRYGIGGAAAVSLAAYLVSFLLNWSATRKTQGASSPGAG